jgi:phage head maturation protease
MDDIKLYIPFEKTDTDERMVYGYASTEALDSQGEVVKVEALQAALPDYMKFANIREMHQPSAVGKAKQASVDGKGLYIGVKVVDNNAWLKVKEGVYNGFSIGGKVLTKQDNAITDLRLSEISLVDRPANPEATFDVIKGEDLKETTPEDIAAEVKIAEEAHEEPIEEEKEAAESPEIAKNIYTAGRLTDIGEDLGYLIQYYQMLGKDTSEMTGALENIKSAAGKELAEPEESDDFEEAERILDLHKDELEKAKRASAEYTMPTDKEIVSELEKQGLPVNEASISIVKAQAADTIISKVKANQDMGTQRDAVVADLERELNEVLGKLNSELARSTPSPLAPFVHYTVTKSEAAEAGKPEEAPTDPQPIKSDQPVDLGKAEGLLQKFETVLAKAEERISSLEERVAKVERTEAPVKAKASFAVERFEKSASEGQSELQKRIDDAAAMLKKDPNNPELQRRAQDLTKEWFESRREQ